MKTKSHPKETLTYANIRRDLRRRLWRSWLSLIVCLSAMVGFIWAFHQVPRLLFESSSGRYHMPGWVMLLFMPYVLYVVIREAWLVSCGFRRKPFIVKDKLASSEGDASMYAMPRCMRCIIVIAPRGVSYILTATGIMTCLRRITVGAKKMPPPPKESIILLLRAANITLSCPNLTTVRYYWSITRNCLCWKMNEKMRGRLLMVINQQQKGAMR